MTQPRDHGGGLDAAVGRYGGSRTSWVDLSTGINPVPYPVGPIEDGAWTALPDQAAMDRLLTAARSFWQVPAEARIIAAPGASALIARMPHVIGADRVYIPSPTYNEHAAAFRAAGREVSDNASAPSWVVVHPNNPDGRMWQADELADCSTCIIDESFCDIAPDASLVDLAARPGTIVLKSFGKFWGLAGLRLGFAIGLPETLGFGGPGESLADMLGPWAVSGPGLAVGARALEDTAWAAKTRDRLALDALRLDDLLVRRGARVIGGTDLFRLYEVDDAALWQDRLAQGHVWSRIFPYSDTWLRLGLPAPEQWDRLEAALGGCETSGTAPDGQAGGAMARPSGPAGPA